MYIYEFCMTRLVISLVYCVHSATTTACPADSHTSLLSHFNSRPLTNNIKHVNHNTGALKNIFYCPFIANRYILEYKAFRVCRKCTYYFIVGQFLAVRHELGYLCKSGPTVINFSAVPHYSSFPHG